jgi:hypothetical protein
VAVRREPVPGGLNSTLEFARHDVIDITPDPSLAGFNGTNQGMFCRVKMLGGMLVLGRIAASHVPAVHTEPQMDPLVA